MGNDPILDRAEDFLERERAILRSGRIAELSEIADMHGAVIASLENAQGDIARIRRLRALAVRNGEMLAASAQGVRRALKRLGELQKASGPIESYSANGRRCEIGSINPKFERKA